MVVDRSRARIETRREREMQRERERESCSNVFGVCCGYNGVRRVRLNGLRSQIDSKNIDKRERDWWALNPPGYFRDWHLGVHADSYMWRFLSHRQAFWKCVLFTLKWKIILLFHVEVLLVLLNAWNFCDVRSTWAEVFNAEKYLRCFIVPWLNDFIPCS